MIVNLDELRALPTLEAGSVVHAELRRLGHKIELGPRGAQVRPSLGRAHPLRPWLWDLAEFCRARCSRCSDQHPATGLLGTYWGEWLCSLCAHELGAVGGELDRNGWPDPHRSAA